MKISISFILLFFTANLIAQNNTVLKKTFDDAVLNFESGKYNSATERLNSIKIQLGTTNPKIQSLLARAYYGSGDYKNAKIEIIKYFQVLSPAKKTGEGYNQMLDLQTEIDKKIEEMEKKAFEKQMQQIEEQEKQKSKLQEQKLSQLKQDRSMELYNKGSFNASEDDLIEFTALFPDSKANYFAKNKLTDISNNNKYENYKKTADTYYQMTNYSSAIENYKSALDFKKNDAYAMSQICKCYCTQADGYFSNKDYNSAISFYKLSFSYCSNNNYAQNKINSAQTIMDNEKCKEEALFEAAKDHKNYVKYASSGWTKTILSTSGLGLGGYLLLAKPIDTNKDNDVYKGLIGVGITTFAICYLIGGISDLRWASIYRSSEKNNRNKPCVLTILPYHDVNNSSGVKLALRF